MKKLRNSLAAAGLAIALVLGAAVPAHAGSARLYAASTTYWGVWYSTTAGGSLHYLPAQSTALNAAQLVVQPDKCVTYWRAGVSPIKKCASVGQTIRIGLGSYSWSALGY